MLIGQFEGKVTEKHQTVLPKEFRKLLGNKVIITKGLEECLLVVSESNWKTLLEGTEGRPFTKKDVRQLQRYLLGNATIIETDSFGRFVLPEYLRQYAFITTNIVYAGISRFVEIWDKTKWEEQQKVLAENAPSIAERLDEVERTSNE